MSLKHSLHKLKHHLKHNPVTTVVHQAEKIVTSVTKPITAPIAKVIAPVVAPVVKVVEPINKILEPANAILKPVIIVSSGGTIQQAVMSVVQDQVVNKVTAPVTNIVNHIANPVDSLIGDATKPIAPVLSTIRGAVELGKNTENLANNIGTLVSKNESHDSEIIKSPEKIEDKKEGQENPQPTNDAKSQNKNGINNPETNFPKINEKNILVNAQQENMMVDPVMPNKSINLQPLKEGYGFLAKVTNEVVKDNQLASITNKVQLGIVNSTLCIAEKLSNGNDIKTTLKDCGAEQIKDTIKNSLEEVVSNSTSKTIGKYIVSSAPKVIGHTAGAVVGEVIFSDPTATSDKDCIKSYNSDSSCIATPMGVKL